MAPIMGSLKSAANRWAAQQRLRVNAVPSFRFCSVEGAGKTLFRDSISGIRVPCHLGPGGLFWKDTEPRSAICGYVTFSLLRLSCR